MASTATLVRLPLLVAGAGLVFLACAVSYVTRQLAKVETLMVTLSFFKSET